MGRELSGLLRLLDLEVLDLDRYLGHPGRGEGRLFGGLVAAQCAIAAGRTVADGRPLHSLHAYFLRPGRHDRPLRFAVDRIRDSRSFATRRVKAHQAGEEIFNMSASFCRPEPGIAHQGAPPEAPGPEGLPDWEEVRARALGEAARRSAVELRMVDPAPLAAGETSPPFQRNWMRLRGALPEDPLVHAALLVYLSDRTLLSTAARPHGLTWGQRFSASLDHSIWIHRPVKLDDWILYAAESPVAYAARGLVFGGLYTRDGTRVASVAQEGLIRRRRELTPEPPTPSGR